MTEKLDYKKAYPRFYAPGRKPERVLVPSMPFLMVDGRGAPDSPAYQAAVQTLYALTFTIKMSRLDGNAPAGYFDYVCPRWRDFGGSRVPISRPAAGRIGNGQPSSGSRILSPPPSLIGQ